MVKASDNNDALYQDVLLKHARQPCGFGTPQSFDRSAKGVNRLCGDTIIIYLTLEAGKIREAAFSGESCAICKGTASMLMSELPGMSLDQVELLVTQFRDFMEHWNVGPLKEFEALKIIKNFPTRAKCLRLPWETLGAALDGHQQAISTE